MRDTSKPTPKASSVTNEHIKPDVAHVTPHVPLVNRDAASVSLQPQIKSTYAQTRPLTA